MIPVILAGGRGRRLWPLSRPHAPKQFLRLRAVRSLLQSTVERARQITGRAPVIVTTRELSESIASHLEGQEHGILAEPARRNTGPAIALVAAQAAPDDMLWIMPADHVVGDLAPLRTALETAQGLAGQGHIVVIGIAPRGPSTRFGYIRRGPPVGQGAFAVASFTEKPDRRTAQAYLEAGDHDWNAGMIVARAGVIRDEIAALAPAYLDPQDYVLLRPAPFDTLVLERTRRAVVVPCALRWRDVGGWAAALATLVDNLRDGA